MVFEDTTQNSNNTILEYVKILLKWSWLLIIVSIVAGAGAYYYSNLSPRVYQSSTRLVVNMPSGVSDLDPSTQSVNLSATYAKTMITQSLLNTTSQRLGYPVTGNISVSADALSPIITITVRDNDPQRAADIANMVVNVFIDETNLKQSSRYTELVTSIEAEIARIDEILAETNEDLASLQPQATDKIRVNSDNNSEERIVDTATIVRRSQLELSISQYTNTRYSLVYNLQQIKLSEIKSKTIFTQLDIATANFSPISPQPFRDASMGAVIGLLLSGGIVFLIAFLKDEIRDPKEFLRVWNLPVLGYVTNNKGSEDTVISILEPRSPAVEDFRILRTNLMFSNIDTPLRTILVTSSSSGDGKTSIASNLAVVMSQNDTEVMLIDCDLRKPCIHRRFQVSNRSGLTSYFFQSNYYNDDVIKETSAKGLFILTAGNIPPNPSELLNSEKMRNIISVFKSKVDTIVIDSPPILAVADALVLAPRVDGVVLVIDPKKTKRAMFNESVNQLRQVNANILGVVVNGINQRQSYRRYYRRGYYYGKTKKSDIYNDDTLQMHMGTSSRKAELVDSIVTQI